VISTLGGGTPGVPGHDEPAGSSVWPDAEAAARSTVANASQDRIHDDRRRREWQGTV
jgi:hypothetical protein